MNRADSAGAKPPSATAAFSTLMISSSHRLQHTSMPTPSIARKVSPEPSTTGPHALPTEIMHMIFHFVFESCLCLKDGVEGGNPALWLDEDPLSPCLFPYAPACVCLRWFRILRAVPIYWTRQVITLDAIATSLIAARTTLAWAGNLPLKVAVTRHRGTSETHVSERASVRRAMELLRPHICRIWSLSFDVEHTASIPALWRESGRAQHLKALTLMSRSDASRTTRISKWRESSYEYVGILQVPLLRKVTLSGHFLRNPLMAHPRLASWFKHTTSLTICGGGAASVDAISLYKFLSVLDIFASVRELTIEDVHFDGDAPYPSLHVLRPAVLCLRRITGRLSLRGLLTPPRAETRSREDITIVDCTVHGFQESDSDSNSRFASTSLTIASMNPNTTIEGLVCRWNGEQLAVIGCPRVSRAFLERLHGESAPMCLSRLRIVDCDHFGAGDVVSLVKSRAKQAAIVSLMDVPDDDVFTALAELRVQGRGPPISVQRAAWLAEHVETFSWDTVAKDGVRYVWDGPAKSLRTERGFGSLEVRVGLPLERVNAHGCS